MICRRMCCCKVVSRWIVQLIWVPAVRRQPGPRNVEGARRYAGSVCVSLTRKRTMFYHSSLLLIFRLPRTSLHIGTLRATPLLSTNWRVLSYYSSYRREQSTGMQSYRNTWEYNYGYTNGNIPQWFMAIQCFDVQTWNLSAINVKKTKSLKQRLTATRPTSHN